MNLSKMQKLSEEADQLITNLQTEPAGASGQDVVQAGAEPTEQVEQNTDQGVATQSVAAEESVADSQPHDTDETVRLKAELEKSEQRYKSLMGMINKRDSENESLRQLVAQLTQKMNEVSAKPAESKPEKPSSLVTKADEETFGGDLVDLIRRAAEEIAEKKFAHLKGEVGGEIGKLSNQVNTVTEVTVKSERDRADDALTSQVPDWREINLDPGFVDFLNANFWLNTLNTAYQQGDVATTAEFFKRYKATKQPASNAPVSSAEKFVAPGKSRTMAPPPGNNGRMWSPADVNKLYDDFSSRKISADEFNKLEADLFKAQRENRFAA